MVGLGVACVIAWWVGGFIAPRHVSERAMDVDPHVRHARTCLCVRDALVPYVRGRSSLNRAVLATDAATTPVYCGLACQSEHWWSDVDPHSQVCPRYDQAIHSLVEDLYPDIHEHDARVPFGAIQSDGTSIPWLVRSSLVLQGLHGGMGYS